MILIHFCPKWFHGIDIVLDFIVMVILISIFLLSNKIYKISRNKKNRLLSWAFLLISLSFLFKILTNFTIYYKEYVTKQIGPFIFRYYVIKAFSLFSLSYFMYHLLGLLGVLLLFFVYQKEKPYTTFLILYLVFLSAMFSHETYYVFHLTNLVFFGILALTYRDKYLQSHNKNTKLIYNAFSLITLSQVLFVFIGINDIIYVIGEIIQIIGYGIIGYLLLKLKTKNRQR